MRIILADDHLIFRQGLKLLLAQCHGYEIVAETGDAAAIRELVQQHQPDLLILDYHMPGCDGGATLAYLKQRHPSLRVVMLTGAQSGAILKQLYDANADGILLKEGSGEELLSAIRRIAAGERVMAKQARSLMEETKIELTAREFQILQMLAAGLSSPAIAERLSLSARTVDKHRENVFRKLEVGNLAQALAKAEGLGLL